MTTTQIGDSQADRLRSQPELALRSPVESRDPGERALRTPLPNGRLSRYPDNMSVLDVHQLPADPLEALRELSLCETELGRLRREAIEAAREVGATWDQVGAALGMSRQAAWEYYTRSARTRLDQTVAEADELSDDDAMKLAVEEVKAARRGRRRA